MMYIVVSVLSTTIHNSTSPLMQDLTEVFMENWMESAPSTLVTISTQRGYARFFFFFDIHT